MRRSIVVLSVVVALGGVACGSKKEDTSTPTLPAGGVTVAPGGDPSTGPTAAPASTFKPTAECTAINSFRFAEAAPAIYLEPEKQPEVVAAVNSTAAAAKTAVPELAASIDVLAANALALSATGSTTPEQKTSGDQANATVTEYWTTNCT